MTKLTIAQYILNILELQERQKSWLAEKVGITKQAIGYKFKNDSFTAEELIRIAKFLNFNLEELKDKI